MFNRIHEWFWGLLPDKCQGPFCLRKGMRGNENVVDELILCDDCTVLFDEHVDLFRKNITK